MFISQQNKKVLYDSISGNPNLSLFLKNEKLLFNQMDLFYQTNDTSKPIMDVNKAFLITYVKMKQTRQELQEVKLSEFDNELQKHQNDFEKTITLKKPQNIQFNEIKEEVLNETNMEKELRQKMEEREKMDFIISHPPIIEVVTEDSIETKLLELQKKSSYDVVKKKVSFQEDEPESSKLDLIMLELTFIKQELIELKKIISLKIM
jgi:hypothetical protein